MKKIVAFALILCVSVGLCGCAVLPSPDRVDAPMPVYQETEPVYFLNSDASAEEMWLQLADKYKAETGISVKVVTPTEDYYSVLASELDRRNAPTMFCLNDPAAAEAWSDYCLELDDTAVFAELSTEEFNMKNIAVATIAVGTGYSAYGIAANSALLELAGYSLADVADFSTMRSVADDIHARAEELGFDAFPTMPSVDADAELIAGMLLDPVLCYQFNEAGGASDELSARFMNKLQNIWSLVNDDAAAPELPEGTEKPEKGEEPVIPETDLEYAVSQFKRSKAVFCLCDCADYNELVSGDTELTGEELIILPIYCGVDSEANAGLCCKGGICWALNNESEQDNIDKTMEFLVWAVTSSEGTAALKEHYGMTVYKGTTDYDNLFFRQSAQYNAEKKYILKEVLEHDGADAYVASVLPFLRAFSKGETEWSEVEDAIIANWSNRE